MKKVSVSELPESVWESEHFQLHPLAEGVYAAIATELGAGFSNAGLDWEANCSNRPNKRLIDAVAIPIT